jgi:hypothetical protein
VRCLQLCSRRFIAVLLDLMAPGNSHHNIHVWRIAACCEVDPMLLSSQRAALIVLYGSV